MVYCFLTGFGANRLQARLATRKAKPAGQFYLHADQVDTYMAEIPLADLPGVGRATLAKLRTFGFGTCGDLQVPTSVLTALKPSKELILERLIEGPASRVGKQTGRENLGTSPRSGQQALGL